MHLSTLELPERTCRRGADAPVNGPSPQMKLEFAARAWNSVPLHSCTVLRVFGLVFSDDGGSIQC